MPVTFIVEAQGSNLDVAGNSLTSCAVRFARALGGSMAGRVLTIHLVEGTASGLQTAEIDNWIGKVFVAPKIDLPMLLKQQEIKDALGVYVLIGDDPNQFGKNIIYIGQGSVTSRLVTHSKDNDKDYWDSKVLVVVAKDGSLNTADCLYLESRLIDLANKSSSADVRNQTNPPPPFLAATDKTRVENFLTQIQTLLPVLNVNFFTPPVFPLSVTPPAPLPAPPAVLAIHNIIAPILPVAALPPCFVYATQVVKAEAKIINNFFVVLKGAIVSPNETSSVGTRNSALRSQLRASGKLINDSHSINWILTDNVDFTSPSAAAAVICGFSAAGPKVWKVKGTQQTYGEWQQAQVNAVSSTGTIPQQ